MYSTPTDNLTFRKGYNFNAKRFCCSPKQRTFKREAYTATYDLDNKLQTFGNKTITYDNDGNMTSGPIIEGGNNAALEFNARGQLMGTGDVAYAYDLENTRTIVMHYDKNKILTQYRYVYNRVGNVPEVLMRVKLTNMTSQSTYYVYGAGLAYEVKITPDGQEAVRYYHYDQVGSTVAMTDSAQAITDRFHYDPWGYVLHSIGDSDTPFQFVGTYGIQTDPNGLINMRARYYNPVTKSFISQDPSGFEGGLNWYLYANGNPFTYIDQNGEFPIAIIAVAVVSGLANVAIGEIVAYATGTERTWADRALDFGIGALTGGISGTLARNVGRATSFTAQSFNRSTNFARAGTSMVDRSVGEQLHHWFIPNNGWGKYVPNAIKNQPWNLNAIPKNSHQFIHGNSPIGYKYSALKSIYYQTPNWAKAVGIGGVLGGSIHLSNATSNYSSFGQSLYNFGTSYITNTNSTSNLSSLGISFK